MSGSIVSNAIMQSQVRVEGLPAARAIVVVERQPDGEWRVCGSGQSSPEGLGTVIVQASPASDIYAVAIDSWGSPWRTGMVVEFGDTVRPSQFAGVLYRVTQAGVLPADEPEWPPLAAGPQPVGTAVLEAVRYWQPIAHGPVPLEFAYMGVADFYPGAVLAYSCGRLLRAEYSGPALRVRRSSDGAEQDIGFVDGVLDESALLTFVGDWDGYVRTLYDQSVSGLHAHQSVAGAQPQIVSGGVIKRINNAPAAAFNGVSNSLAIGSVDLTTTSAITMFCVVSSRSVGAGMLFEFSSNYNLNNRSFYLVTGEKNAGDISIGRRGATSLPGVARITSGRSTPFNGVISFSINLAAADVAGEVPEIRVNGYVNPATDNNPGGTAGGPFGAYPAFIGMRGGVSLPWSGELGELILYPSLTHANEIRVDQSLMLQHEIPY